MSFLYKVFNYELLLFIFMLLNPNILALLHIQLFWWAKNIVPWAMSEIICWHQYNSWSGFNRMFAYGANIMRTWKLWRNNLVVKIARKKGEKKIRTSGKLLGKHGSKSTWNSTSSAVLQDELTVNSATAGCLSRRKTNCHLLSSCIFLMSLVLQTKKEVWGAERKNPFLNPSGPPGHMQTKTRAHVSFQSLSWREQLPKLNHWVCVQLMLK